MRAPKSCNRLIGVDGIGARRAVHGRRILHCLPIGNRSTAQLFVPYSSSCTRLLAIDTLASRMQTTTTTRPEPKQRASHLVDERIGLLSTVENAESDCLARASISGATWFLQYHLLSNSRHPTARADGLALCSCVTARFEVRISGSQPREGSI